MPIRLSLQEQLSLGRHLVRTLLLTIPLGLLVGSACAMFLWSLERATALRFEYPWLIWLLPVGGAAIGWMYLALGKAVEAGNNLIVDEIHRPGGGVPLRMAPLVLVGTVVTHLFGGSAGREGTAVQMGGSIASGLVKYLPWLDRSDGPTMLMAGIAAGFGGVFGTPVAGMVFAMEVLVVGRIDYRAILPCLSAAIISDRSCLAWGIGHTNYHLASILPEEIAWQASAIDGRLMLCAIGGGILFGLTSLLFAELTHGLHWLFKRLVPWPILRPVLGGCVVICLVFLAGTRDYLGLGVTSPDPQAVTIVSSFQEGGAHSWSWLWKILFTAVTLGSGFKGGEVTPLFYIGAALGNTLAMLTGAPVDVLAAMGFVSVFAGATNTPLACTMMAVELFGGEFAVYFAISCVMAYIFSGHSGIYLAQRIGTPKYKIAELPRDASLRMAREVRLGLHEWRVEESGRKSLEQEKHEESE
jgi:H+/Cl- antiporter ClcA